MGSLVHAVLVVAGLAAGADVAERLKAREESLADGAASYRARADAILGIAPETIRLIGKDGKTDAISGATMAVAGFYELVRKALAGQSIAKGPYKDGWYYYEQPEFDKSGWKETVLVTVVNGSVVDLVWNGVSNKAGSKSKILESISGKYKMGAKNGEWHVQAARLSAAIVEAGDPAKIAVKKDEFLIGRSPECNLCAGSTSISRRHCAIMRNGTKVTIKDFGI